MRIFKEYGCNDLSVDWDSMESTKTNVWNDYRNWQDSELRWAELDAMADSALEWEERHV